VYEKILNSDIKYPHYVSERFPARTLVEKLLNRNASLRGDPATVKQHPYFKNFDWNALISR
jgi:hypothetical protein